MFEESQCQQDGFGYLVPVAPSIFCLLCFFVELSESLRQAGLRQRWTVGVLRGKKEKDQNH